MSDNYLFQAKNGWQLLVFGVSLKDAREYAKRSHPLYDMKFVMKNPSGVSPWLVCATTAKQVDLNRTSLERLMNGV